MQMEHWATLLPLQTAHKVEEHCAEHLLFEPKLYPVLQAKQVIVVLSHEAQ
jgi:hypothetical protein